MDRIGPFLRPIKTPKAPPGLIELCLESDPGGPSGRIGIVPRNLSHLKLLEGIDAGKSLARVGFLFTLCRMAQTTLAREALCCAQSRPILPNERRKAEWMVLKESLLESLRTVLTLPGTSFSPSGWNFDDFRGLANGVPDENPDTPFWRAFREISERSVFGGPSSRFMEMDSPEQWDQWAQSGKKEKNTPVSLLARELFKEKRMKNVFFPEMTTQRIMETREVIMDSLHNVHFLTHPHLRGVFHETGPKSRMSSHPLVISLDTERPLAARLASRLLELASWAAEGPRMVGKSLLFGIASESTAPGTGLAWAETARGVLVHLATVRNGQTGIYRILAPTEWTFHPEGGPFKRWVNNWHGLSGPCEESGETNEFWTSLDQALWIFDPCTPVRLPER
ncbi:hypothetical protein [Leptospirillum ferrooxidans]|jgi:hypothetical protein|uniref:Uncharacterized protein n=1 Tax=Leptospirillum ferrooxidans (strain C2-3) TaxID=1162668 RepID=I0IS55_LEPFC|nr:hypothetical protein [Leptospirillum ferrooxidans]BAM08104.1 hypothetical protein LFE_2433 [Leptospirillum ferrooxidans C2-3]